MRKCRIFHKFQEYSPAWPVLVNTALLREDQLSEGPDCYEDTDGEAHRAKRTHPLLPH